MCNNLRGNRHDALDLNIIQYGMRRQWGVRIMRMKASQESENLELRGV